MKEERRKRVKELYNQGIAQKEIAEKLEVVQSVISRDIEYLREQGEIKDRKQERREKVKELYNQRKKHEEIAQELKCSQATISKDIKYLKEQKEISEKKEGNIIQERREKVKELYNQGTAQKETIEKLEVVQSVVSEDIKYLKEQESQELKNIQVLCNKFYGQTRILKKFQKYILDCKTKFQEGNLKAEELPTIKKVVSLTDNYQDSVFYIRACIKLNKIKEAMEFANTQMWNEELTKEEKEKIKILREKIKEINKKYIAIRTLQRGKGIEQAIKDSGLQEIEVIELKRKLLHEEQKNRKEEEEEPNI